VKYAKIRKKRSEFCEKCNNVVPEIKEVNDGRPVSFFVVGADMKQTKRKLMFVAKTVTSNWGENANLPDPIHRESGFIDTRYNSESLFLKQDNMFFICIAEVCRSLWGNQLGLREIWHRIAVTDIVKCSNNSESWRAKTEGIMKNNCVEAGFLKAEIEEVKPTHLMFFTGHDYDSQIQELLGYEPEITDEPEKEIRIWWTMPSNNQSKMQVLRTYHPHYFNYHPKQKTLFYQKIATWIKTT